jgi:uncharacterized protein
MTLSAHVKHINEALSSDLFKEDMMTIEQTHGLLCAVVSSPVEVPQTQWISAIFDEEKKVIEKEETKPLIKHLVAWHNEIQKALEKSDVIEPCIIDAGKHIPYQKASNEQIASWAAGYMAGILLNQADWLESGHREIYQVLTPITSFAAAFADKIPKGAQKPPAPEVVRANYLTALPSAIQSSYDFWRQHQGCSHGHHDHDHGHSHGGGTIRYDQPKTGRNDPCTCGSGKKYKKCCGG